MRNEKNLTFNNKKMFSKKFLLPILLLFLSQCHMNSRYAPQTFYTLNYEEIESIKIPIPQESINQWNLKIISEKGKKYLFFYDRDHIFIYNLCTGKQESEIFVNRLRYADIISLDSIFIFLYHKKFVYDSVFFRINNKGRILNVYSFKGAPLFSKLNNIKSPENSAYTSYNFVTVKNKVFFKLFPLLALKINDSIYQKAQIPLYGYLDLAKDTFICSNLKNIPFFDKQRVYPLKYANFYYYPSEKFIIHSFVFSQYIAVENMTTGKINKFYAKSELIDTIRLDSTDNLIQPPFYANMERLIISQDTFYLRTFVLSENDYGKIILDKNFKKIGETFKNLPVLYSSGDTFYCFNKNASLEKEDTLVLSLCKISLKKVKIKSYIDSIKKQINHTKESCEIVSKQNYKFDTLLLKKYADSLLKQNNYIALMIPVFKSCHSCVDQIIKFYSINQLLFSQKNVWLVAIDNDTNKVKKYIKMQGINVKTIKIVSHYKFFNILKQPTLEHLLIVKNNRLTFFKSYYPNEIDSMLNLVIKKIID